MGMFVVAPTNHHLSDHAHAHSLNTAAVGVIPLLTATPCLTAVEEGITADNRGVRASSVTIASNSTSLQFWQTPQNYLKRCVISDCGGASDGVGVGSASTSGSTMSCQDCGNQAKKDCSHRRCRTCCKSRGFHCPTHVKSTWVPASRRRERQLIGSAGSASTSTTKKPRLASRTTTTSHTSTSNTDTSSSHHQDASFMQSLPAQVRAPAVFKCVRVTAVEDGDDEYAYQACVTISGHVFKGFLYDQGVEPRDQTNIPNISELHLGGGGGGGGRNAGGSLASSPHDHRGVYGSSGSGLLG